MEKRKKVYTRETKQPIVFYSILCQSVFLSPHKKGQNFASKKKPTKCIKAQKGSGLDDMIIEMTINLN